MLHRPHRGPGQLHLTLLGGVHAGRHALESLTGCVLRCEGQEGSFSEAFGDCLGETFEFGLHHFVGKRIFEPQGQVVAVYGVTDALQHAFRIGREGRDLQRDLPADRKLLCVISPFGIATLAEIITDAVGERRDILQRPVPVDLVATAGE